MAQVRRWCTLVGGPTRWKTGYAGRDSSAFAGGRTRGLRPHLVSFADQILLLRGSSPELELAYHQEVGKVDARRIGRHLRAAGIKRGWFALYEGMVIASAAERKDLVRRIQEVLPAARSHLPLPVPAQEQVERGPWGRSSAAVRSPLPVEMESKGRFVVPGYWK